MSAAGSKLLETVANQAATIKVQTFSRGSKHMLTTITGKAVLTTKSQIASNSLAAGRKEIAKMLISCCKQCNSLTSCYCN